MALKNILDSGVQEGQPPHLQAKIKSSNMMGLILGPLLGAVTFYITNSLFPSLTLWALAPMVLFAPVFLINQAGATYFSRIYLALGVVIWSALFHAGLIGSAASAVPGLAQLQLALVVVAFRLIDLRERNFYFLTAVLGLVVLFFTEYSDRLTFDVDPDAVEALRTGWYGILYTGFAVGVFFLTVIMMLRDNVSFENRAEQLLEEADSQTRQREDSERELRESLEKLQTAQEEERERQWIAQGLAEIQSIMRQSSEDVQKVYDSVLSYIVNYLDANQGALLTVERDEMIVDDDGDDEGYIELKSTYAYKRKKFLKRDIAIGEGLIGQAYLERDYIYLTEVPNDYVNITSGLGEARPRSVLIMPLMENDLVQGFIELASFKELAPYQISYLEQAATSIASFLRTTRVNQRTKELLVQAQQQTEEMKAQEEEMRQNAEEIYAMSKTFKMKDKENQAKIKELEAKIKELEEKNMELSS